MNVPLRFDSISYMGAVDTKFNDSYVRILKINH